MGIRGTDTEDAEGGRADAPVGKHDLVLGHEMFGRDVHAGKKTFNKGLV